MPNTAVRMNAGLQAMVSATSVEPMAMNVFGRSVPGSAWEKLTEQIMAALGKELGIPADRTYIRYTATTDWGWNGGNF